MNTGEGINGAPPARALRLAVVDSHPAQRQGLEQMIRARGHELIVVAASARDGYEAIRRLRATVAVIEVSLEDGDGVELTWRLRHDAPGTAVVLYVPGGDRATVAAALDSPARAVLLTTASEEQVLRAIEVVAGGGTYVDDRLHGVILGDRRADRLGVLSRREREVLHLLAGGATGEQVAQRLYLSPETVKTHIRNSMGKLGARTRVHAVALAIAAGELEYRPANGRQAAAAELLTSAR